MALLLSGCGGGDEGARTVPCDDAAFRAQDEELYVTKATIANALGGGGDPSQTLLDLRRARKALGDYLDAHPPCDEALAEVAAGEREGLASLDSAIDSLVRGADAETALRAALAALAQAQRRL